MTSQNQRILPDVLRSIDSSTFTGSYQALGDPLTYSTRIMKFTNNTNVLVTLSWDGVNDHDILTPASFLLLDISANKENTGIYEVAAGTQLYVKASAGTGLVYLSTYYGS